MVKRADHWSKISGRHNYTAADGTTRCDPNCLPLRPEAHGEFCRDSMRNMYIRCVCVSWKEEPIKLLQIETSCNEPNRWFFGRSFCCLLMAERRAFIYIVPRVALLVCVDLGLEDIKRGDLAETNVVQFCAPTGPRSNIFWCTQLAK